MTTPARIALAASLCSLLAQAAMAQTSAVPPAPPPPAAPQPDIQYDTWFQPFDDSPLERLQDIVPLPPPTPLFQDFDSLAGLDQHVKTSRVTLTNRAIFAYPVMTVRVGQEFDVPCYYASSARLSGVTLRTVYANDKIVPSNAKPDQWNRSTVVFNAKPEDTDSPNIFVIVQYSADSFAGPGTLFTVRFKAIAPGESPIEVHGFDASDDVNFDHVRSLVRDGLVLVQP